jgi:hypothetical protein
LLPTMLVIMFGVNGIIHLKDVKSITAAMPEKGSDEPVYFKPAFDIYEIAVAKALEHLELHDHQKDVFADSSLVNNALVDNFLEIQKLINESEANRLLVDL